MVDYIEPYIKSGDKWEEFCNRCYRIRYQNYGYQEIPAAYKGDGGIEGFTDNGIVYQCYCPEKDYSDDDLYEHYRNKMHTDIGKFIDPDYEKTLKKLGLHDISEWHFVIPYNRDKRILEYRTQQVKRVLEYKSEHPEQCSYISDDFKIIIKIADDFLPELARMTRMQVGYELDLRLSAEEAKLNWSECPSEKVDNIKRKIRAVMGNDPDDDDYNEVVTTFIEAYIAGLNMMEKLRKEQVDIYEEIMSLKSSYKRKVATKTRINSDHSLNQNIFDEIMADFQNQLKEKFVFLNQETRDELLFDIIGEWLADCPMQFKL